MVIEPVVENLLIVLPDEGYLDGVRQLCDRYGVVLVFDEVKTGLTAGYAGAAQRLGAQPDLITRWPRASADGFRWRRSAASAR